MTFGCRGALGEPERRPRALRARKSAKRAIVRHPPGTQTGRQNAPKMPIGLPWATFYIDFGPQGHPRVRVQKNVTKSAHFGTPWTTQNHDFALRVLQIRYFHLSRKSPQNGPQNGTQMHQLAPFWAPGGSHGHQCGDIEPEKSEKRAFEKGV